jgi:hypothetical protein
VEKHFVTFESPGTLFPEYTTRKIESWDIDKAVEMSRSIAERHGAVPYGFQFSTRSRKEDELDSSVSAKSNMYYLGGRIMTLAEVKDEMPSEEILISNMEGNDWNKIIVNHNSWRIVRPFKENDILLEHESV